MSETLDQEVQAIAEQKGLTYPKVRLDRNELWKLEGYALALAQASNDGGAE